jgi:hypothetical protein
MSSFAMDRKKRGKWVASLKVGDEVHRIFCVIGGEKHPQKLKVAKIENGFIYLQVPGTTGESEGDFWCFDGIGVEYDPDIPITVSIIMPVGEEIQILT